MPPVVSKTGTPEPINLLHTVVGGVDLDTYDAEAKLSGEVAVWGLVEGNSSTWENIDDGDYLFFYVGDGDYEYACEVLDKERNAELAKALWPNYRSGETSGDDPGQPWEYIVYLDFPTKIDLDAHEIHGPAGYANDYIIGFQPLNEAGHEYIHAEYGDIESLVDVKHNDGQTAGTGEGGEGGSQGGSGSTSADSEEQAVDLRPPERTNVEVSRVIRNTTLAKELKELYNHHCQVCGEQRNRAPDEPYAEAHHVKPLGGSPPGPDVEENIIVLCPDHHADFDYGMIEVDPDSFEITHGYDSSLDGERLQVESSHNLGTNFFEYHNQQISKL